MATGGKRVDSTGYRVSVVVPTYNRARYIEECLESLLTQSVPAHEIIVIDDGSEDDTALRLASYGKLIRYVRKKNGGKPSAVNLALTLIEGDLVWLFDDDDVALPDAIKDRVEALKRNPGAGFVYSPHYLGVDGADGRIVRGRLHESPAYGDERFFFELMKGCFFHLATALVRIELYREAGMFDPQLLSSEDYDMQIRLARRAPAAFCANPTFVFRQHSGVRGAKAIRYRAADRTRMFMRYDRIVGKKIRDAVPLGDFLTPRTETLAGTGQIREALFARMTVMASKGCVRDMIDDLIAALHTPGGGGGALTVREAELIEMAPRTGYAFEAFCEGWSECTDQLGKLARCPGGRTALMRLSRGLLATTLSRSGSIGGRLKGIRISINVFRLLFWRPQF